MEESKNISEKGIPALEPLVLSRRAVAIIIAIATVLWFSAFLLWKQAEFDKQLLVSLNGLRTERIVVDLAQAATRYGMSVIVLIYLLYLLSAFKYEKLRDAYRIYLMVFLMFGVAAVGGDGLKEILKRPRPFVEYAGQINSLSRAKTPAFPSGHATKSVALVLPFLLLITAKDNMNRGVKIILAFIAFGVCSSRVLLGAHYLSDVLAGIGMALVCFPLVIHLSNKILRKMTQERLKAAVKVWALILFGLMIYLVVM